MDEMDLKINLSKEYTKPQVIINAPEMTKELEEIVARIQNTNFGKIIGFIDDEAFILEKDTIESIYAEDKKVLARVGDKTYVMKKRIFELENILSESNFVRISNSEIVNFKKVVSMDFKITGTILLKLKSGAITYTSRRYIKKIKEYLGI